MFQYFESQSIYKDRVLNTGETIFDFSCGAFITVAIIYHENSSYSASCDEFLTLMSGRDIAYGQRYR